MLKIMVIGATSAIAQATTRHFAEVGAMFFLVGRDAEKLTTVGQDLTARGAKAVYQQVLDVNDFDQHAPTLEAALAALDGLDVVLIAHGTLTDQKKAEADVDYAMQELQTNALSIIALLTLIANHFEKQRRGHIAVISSVAGDRGRPSNYVYGTAKAAVSTYLQGLRARMDKVGVQVLTIKPGQVSTPMTADLKKSPLFANPEKVGADIYKAMNSRQNVVYTPWFWMLVMLVIRNIPERIFKKLNL
jgi:hypothetical protein